MVVGAIDQSPLQNQMLHSYFKLVLDINKIKKVLVANTGDRPIQVGSHFHFYEVNQALQFEREPTKGMRLNIPAGTAVRFEPGEEKEIELVAIAGRREIYSITAIAY